MDLFTGAGFDPWITVFMISMMPLIELRGAVIVGSAYGLPVIPMMILCIIANMIPIPFVIIFGRKILDSLEKTRLLGDKVRRYKESLSRRSSAVKKYGPIALVTFVGIPLPGTGAWSGALIAVLLGLRLTRAVPAIFIGVIIAGVIMTSGMGALMNIVDLFA